MLVGDLRIILDNVFGRLFFETHDNFKIQFRNVMLCKFQKEKLFCINKLNPNLERNSKNLLL